MKNKIEFIAFDADDTLWENELYFQELEHKFCHLLRKYSPVIPLAEIGRGNIHQLLPYQKNCSRQK